jgi:hypothetical protein
MPRLNAKSLKVTCVLNADEVAVIPDVGSPRVLLHIAVPEIGVVTTDIAAKSVRKVQAQVAEHGSDAIAVILQGRLASGGRIVDAGIVAQVKTPEAAA